MRKHTWPLGTPKTGPAPPCSTSSPSPSRGVVWWCLEQLCDFGKAGQPSEAPWRAGVWFGFFVAASSGAALSVPCAVGSPWGQVSLSCCSRKPSTLPWGSGADVFTMTRPVQLVNTLRCPGASRGRSSCAALEGSPEVRDAAACHQPC